MKRPVKQGMNQPANDSVNIVLSMLNAVQPSEHFQARLQRSLEGRTPSQKGSFLPWFWEVPMGALACAALVIMLLHHAPRPDLWRHAAPTGDGPPVAAVSHAQSAMLVARDTQGSELQRKSSVSSRTHQAGTPRQALVRVSARERAGDPSEIGASTSLAELAASEASAPSRPAPPLPTTAEERAIHRFTQRHNAYQLAALTPARAQLQQREEFEAFRTFFAPPPEPSGNDPAQSSTTPPPSVIGDSH